MPLIFKLEKYVVFMETTDFKCFLLKISERLVDALLIFKIIGRMDYWNLTKLSSNLKFLFHLFQKLEPKGPSLDPITSNFSDSRAQETRSEIAVKLAKHEGTGY